MKNYLGPLPNKSQLRYHKEKLACFMHFGMNTFNDKEWGDGKEELSSFTLKDFDFDDYIFFIKEIGFKRLIFTAKHHDGFCMWNTKYSEHNVMNTPYGRDFLEELSSACTKHDMDMGIYLSPWDVHEKTYGEGEAYNEYYQNQLKEICENPKYGNNGKFVEWWFDGAKDPAFVDQTYNFDKWMDIVRKSNPEIIMFGVGALGGIHWVGNEKGFSMDPNTLRLKKNILEINYDIDFNIKKGHDDKYIWSVPECDTSVTSGWFWHEDEKVKSKSELIEIVERSIGMSSVLLLNIAPNIDGKIPKNVKNNIREVKKHFDNLLRNEISNYKSTECISDEMSVYEIEFDKKENLNMIIISEDISKGQRIVGAKVFLDGKLFKEINSIGLNRMISLENTECKNLKIEFESIAEIKILGVKIFAQDLN